MDVSVVMSTPKYDESAKTYQAVHFLDTFARRLRDNPQYEPNQRFHFAGNYLASRIGNKRVLFTYEERMVHGQSVRCFVALVVMKVGSAEFDRFQNRTTTDAERDSLTGRAAIGWASIWNKIQDAGAIPPPQPLPDMSEAEHAFVTRDTGYVERVFEVPIFETSQWIDKIVSNDFGDPYKVADALDEKIYDVEIMSPEQEILGDEIKYSTDNDGTQYSILYWRLLKIEETESGPRKRYGWFLIALGSPSDIEAVRKELGKELESPTYDSLAQLSRRAYPLDMLKDKDRWNDMEKDRDSNLILSDEEVTLVSKKLDFPLFVTGRAGSGKSTMLQYLFADYFLRYLETGIEYPPLYLSYSKKLVDNAKSLASMLFEKNHTFVEQIRKLDLRYTESVEPKLAGSFRRFEDIVREYISRRSPNVVAKGGRFSDGYVSYSGFRSMWFNRFGKDPRAVVEYGPELSWHVIRSYIKGWDCESYCEPEDYAASDFGKKNKSVSDEVYRKIYERVWSWYKEEQDSRGLWDDQDLIRYCLSPDDDSGDTCVEPRFSAIFCDESQDFTRIETEFIIRLSIFSQRRIDDCVGRLPFVFVGDEFQTLNPTGFSWASLRSYFSERLCRMTRCAHVFGAPEPEELTHNYRSTVPVVKFSNRLQLLRYARCGGEARVEPQIPHYAEKGGGSVFCLNANDQMVWDRLSEMGACLIIPSADGQSAKDFIEASPIKGMVGFYEDGSAKNITIYNPVTAKGLEYPIVAVYGFDGDDVLPPELHLDRLLKWADSGAEDSDARGVAIKYFLSNAYVSVTRAKRRLFILTDRPAKESFWAFALASGDSTFQEKVNRLEGKMVDTLKNKDSWIGRPGQDMLGWMVEGSANESMSVGEGGIVNAREAAEQTKKQGLNLHDPGLLRQAAARFREQSDSSGAAECEAYAYYYERIPEKTCGYRHFRKAGECFLEAGKTDWAFKAFWRDCQKDNLTSLSNLSNLHCAKFPLLGELVRLLLGGVVGISVVVRQVDKLLAIMKSSDENDERKLVEQDRGVLKAMLGSMLSKLPQLNPDDRDLCDILFGKLAELDSNGIAYDKEECARRAFSVGLYQKAIDFWDIGGSANRPSDYYQAKLHLVSYPDTLHCLELSGKADWKSEVIRQFREDGERAKRDGGNPTRLVGHNRCIVAQALFELGTKEEASRVMPFLLVISPTREQAQKTLGIAVASRGVKCSKMAFEKILDLKFNVSTRGRFHFSRPTADEVQFAGIVNKVVDVRSPEFMARIDKAISRDKLYVRDIMTSEIGSFMNNRWNTLLLVEVGRIMEKRGFHVDAARYYEWARSISADENFRRLADMRWVFCKEQQARRTDSAEAEAEALRRRLEIGISEDEVMSPEIEMDWLGYFRQLMSLQVNTQFENRSVAAPVKDVVDKQEVRDVKATGDQQEPTAIVGSVPAATTPESEKSGDAGDSEIQVVASAAATAVSEGGAVPPPDPSRFYNYNVADCVIRYKPNSQLIIKCETDVEDWSVKFTRSEFPQGVDMHVSGGRLVTGDDAMTPFAVAFDNGAVRVTIIESGVAMLFPLPA